MRCHRLDNHIKMPCPHTVEKTCDRGHKLKVACHKRNEKCRRCVKEDAEAEQRAKRDLKLEADRQAREAAYQKELEKIQDEIDHQRRIIKYRNDEEAQTKTLAQQRADLAALKDTADRIARAPKPASVMPGSFPHADPPSPPEASGSSDKPEGARKEWEYMKQFQGAKSEPLDELMGMIGLEEVKSEFLSIKSRVDTALRQCISLSKERFSCSMLGNPGTGKWVSVLLNSICDILPIRCSPVVLTRVKYDRHLLLTPLVQVKQLLPAYTLNFLPPSASSPVHVSRKRPAPVLPMPG